MGREQGGRGEEKDLSEHLHLYHRQMIHSLYTLSTTFNSCLRLQLNANLTELNDLANEIEQQLDTSERMLDAANAFDGSVDGTTAQDVQTQLLFYNTTVAVLAEEANASLAALMQNQTHVNELWAEADNITMTAETLLASLAQYENDTQTAAALVDDFWNDFDSLRANLTILNMTASSLTSQLQTLLEEAANASADVALANATLQSFLLQLQQKSLEIEAALQQAQQLNSSVEDAQMAALQTHNSTAALLVRKTLNAVRKFLVDGGGGGGMKT